MKREKRGGFVAGILLVLLLGALALGGYWIWEKARERTMPQLTYESVDTYTANIGNALANDRELELPPEILSTLLKEASGREIACAVTAENRLKVWFQQEVQVLGKTDVALELDIQSYDRESGLLVLKIEAAYLGGLKVPELLRKPVLELAEGYIAGLQNERVSVESDIIRITLDKLTTEVFGVRLEAGVASIALREGRLYCGLFADINLLESNLLEALAGEAPVE